MRTTYGSAVFADHVPSATAEAVVRLERAGWIDVGKTNLHEFAYGVTSQNLHYGTVPNPAFPGLTAGGSSGGSAAALVAGLADGALGTDSGGSVRIPAACCGIVGFKPTYGLVPIAGVFPLAPSFDHVGPMGSDLLTIATMMTALVPGFETPHVSLPDLSFAVTWGSDPPVQAARIEFPTAEAVVPAFMREVADVHRDLYADNAELYGENIRWKIEKCLAVDDSAYEVAVRARAELADRAEAAMEGFDLLLAPALSVPVPPVDVVETEVRAAMTLYNFPFNALGWPSLAIGQLQVVGRTGADSLVLAAGAALEAVLEV